MHLNPLLLLLCGAMEEVLQRDVGQQCLEHRCCSCLFGFFLATPLATLEVRLAQEHSLATEREKCTQEQCQVCNSMHLTFPVPLEYIVPRSTDRSFASTVKGPRLFSVVSE